MNPLYAIVNTCDNPIVKHVAELRRIGYCYMDRVKDPYLKQYDGMTPKRPTDIKDFGFDVIDQGGNVRFVKTRESIATYEDGKIRFWQDPYKTDFILPKVKNARRRKERRGK